MLYLGKFLATKPPRSPPKFFGLAKRIQTPPNPQGNSGLEILIIVILPQFLLMEEILHQLIDRLSHNLQGFVHTRWLFGISSINSMLYFLP